MPFLTTSGCVQSRYRCLHIWDEHFTAPSLHAVLCLVVKLDRESQPFITADESGPEAALKLPPRVVSRVRQL